jgi:protein involved in polysaccharide export with SLBB domain
MMDPRHFERGVAREKRLRGLLYLCCIVLTGAALVGALGLATGCAKKPLAGSGSGVVIEAGKGFRRAGQQTNRRYVLRPWDVIDVKFYYNPELNEELVVRPDGKISLQLIDEVTVEGLTPAEVDSMLTALYTDKIPRPEVAVIVKEFPGMRVYVGGEVNVPGIIPLSGRMTSLQAIFHAGGFKRSARLGNIVILRDQGREEPLFLTIDLDDVLNRTGGEGDVVLEPYDIVFVPKTKIAKLNDFIDQYIENLIPISVAFGLTYNLNPQVELKQK